MASLIAWFLLGAQTPPDAAGFFFWLEAEEIGTKRLKARGKYDTMGAR